MSQPTAKARPRLVFAHANGFPGLSYKSLLAPLADTFDVHPLERLGHNPDYPVNHNWGNMVDELLARLPENGEPILGVGHSLGGLLMAMAARQRPERFYGVIMLDPPMLLGIDALAMKAAKRLGFIDRITPAGKTLKRRREWPSREAMAHSLRRRGLFRSFTAEALNDYVQAGSRPLDDGRVTLAFQPEIEVEIFRHLPDDITRLPQTLGVPSVLVAGETSDLMTAARVKRLKRRGMRVLNVPGSHMFPMEYPAPTREAIRQAWAMIEAANASA
jgi:pimeloyl-ACP methyl ester carboxylesterase